MGLQDEREGLPKSNNNIFTWSGRYAVLAAACLARDGDRACSPIAARHSISPLNTAVTPYPWYCQGVITLKGIGEAFEHCRHASIRPFPETVTRSPALPDSSQVSGCRAQPSATSELFLRDAMRFPWSLPITATRANLPN
jgi:hypothetical protein